MNFGADASNAPLSGIIKKRRDQSASDAFASPLTRNKERDDIHRLAAKFRAPFVGSIGVAAQSSLIGLCDCDETTVRRIHYVLKYPARIFDVSLRADIHQEIRGQFAQLIHILR